MKIAVVTPTTGNPYLAKAILSVRYQTVPVDHYVFVDGKEYWAKTYEITRDHPHLKVYQLPENTGKGGWNGHRIYAAAPLLINADYILFLDEDNFFHASHCESLVNFIAKNKLDWAYSLRTIHGEGDEEFFRDDCDSLGFWGNYCDGRPGFADTSVYAFRKDIIVQICHAWYNQRYSADWEFYQVMKEVFPKFGCTGQYTSAYRLHGKTLPRKEGWFEVGLRKAQQAFPNGFPWQTERINDAPPVQLKKIL